MGLWVLRERERGRGEEIWGCYCGQPWVEGEEIFAEKLDFDCVWLNL